MRRYLDALLLAVAVLIVVPAAARAEACTHETIRGVVDEAARALRRIHQEMQPRLDTGFRKLKARRGWSDEEYVDRANDFLADDRTEAFDAKASELLARLDRLGETAPGQPADCSRVPELEATALELAAAVRGKLRYMLARLDAATGEAAAAATPPEPRREEPAPPPPKEAAPKEPQARVAPPQTSPPPAPAPAPTPPRLRAIPEKAERAERAEKDKGDREKGGEKGGAEKSGSTASAQPVPPPPARAPTSGWTTSTVEERVPVPPPPAPTPPARMPPPLPPGAHTPDEFSIDEIREASRGFFGTLSSELAAVIEHAFAAGGSRPTGYILGEEGGGAFIAGLRYGRGKLITRSAPPREVFWHGPSIGYDFGASGSKTLFLVYRLSDPLDIFNGFSGVDGSAYLIGGVGMTLLTDGRLVLAPIRTGLGLRIGANIGYIRFTPRQTWNPF